MIVSLEHLARSNGIATAIVVNSGRANACTGEAGLAAAREMAAETARLAQCPVEQVLVASTGVIGVIPDVNKIKAGLASASQALSSEGHGAAAQAIITTGSLAERNRGAGVDARRPVARRGHGQGRWHD